jgi:aspartyl-tRNA(Asn)/glutamyl-tRNA(Gln) amidotransferase subunit A
VRTLYRNTRGQGFGPEVRRRILVGTYVLSSGYYEAYYGRAQRMRGLIAQDFDRVFGDGIDLIFTPATPTPAFRAGENMADPVAMYLADIFTISANLAGLPGMSIPCGMRERLPIGLQLIGPALGEPALFRVAGAYQAATDWHTRRPALG